MASVILITGAGSGIGKLSAETLARAGHTVYATMRDIAGRNAGRAQAMRDWAAAHGADLHPLELDVLSQASADAAVAAIVQAQGRLDVVMQNAGHLVIGPTEAFTAEDMQHAFDTNFYGAQRVNRAALPQLRRQQSGLMLWISSTTTKGGFPPFMGPYGAAKAAMDSLAVSLSYELARFGIETSIVVPGAFTRGTEHFPSAGKPSDQARVAAYARYDGVMDQVGARLSALTPRRRHAAGGGRRDRPHRRPAGGQPAGALGGRLRRRWRRGSAGAGRGTADRVRRAHRHRRPAASVDAARLKKAAPLPRGNPGGNGRIRHPSRSLDDARRMAFHGEPPCPHRSLQHCRKTAAPRATDARNRPPRGHASDDANRPARGPAPSPRPRCAPRPGPPAPRRTCRPAT